MLGSIQLINPNQSANYPSDIFVSKWRIGGTTGLPVLNVNAEIIQLYPNPSSADVEFDPVTHGMKGDFRIMLFDVSGHKIYQQDYSSDVTVKINTKDFPAGIYFLKIIDDHNQRMLNSKIIVTH